MADHAVTITVGADGKPAASPDSCSARPGQDIEWRCDTHPWMVVMQGQTRGGGSAKLKTPFAGDIRVFQGTPGDADGGTLKGQGNLGDGDTFKYLVLVWTNGTEPVVKDPDIVIEDVRGNR